MKIFLRPATMVGILQLACILKPTTAEAQSGTLYADSVKIDLKQKDYRYRSGPQEALYSCGTYLWGTFPDADSAGNGYTIVSKDDQYWSNSAYVLTSQSPDIGLTFSQGQKAIWIGSTGVQGGGAYSSSCGYYSQVYSAVLSGFGQWYAKWNVEEGQPVAIFKWENTQGKTVHFDGSFAHDLSHEFLSTGKVAVKEYLWDLGNGASQTAAEFDYAYAEPGTYVVKLTVTDDDGQTDDFKATVEVPGVLLEYSMEVLQPTVDVLSSFDIEISVTNRGSATAATVVVPKDAEFRPTYPGHDPPADGETLTNATRQPKSDVGTMTFTGVGPGETVKTTQTYEVLTGGKSKIGDVTTSIDVDWTGFVAGVSGTDEDGNAAKTRNACDGCAKITVKPQTLDVKVVAMTVDGEVSVVQTGLRRYTNALFQRGIFKHLVLKDSKAQCNSGCADLEIVVKSVEGTPIEGATVKLSREITVPPDAPLKTKDGKVLLIIDDSQGFFCDIQNCGRTLTLSETTDSEGKVRARYWLPPVISPVSAKITAEVTTSTASKAVEATLSVVPTPVDFGDKTYQPGELDLVALKLMRGVTSVTEFADLPGWCKWANEKLLTTDVGRGYEGEYVSAAKTAIGWGCGEVMSLLFDPIVRHNPNALDPTEKFALLDAFNKLTLSLNLIWFQRSFDISLVGTGRPKLAPTPPFLDMDSDFADVVKSSMREMAKQLTIVSTPPPVNLKLIEASYFEENSVVDLVPHTKLFYVLQDAEKKVDARNVVDLGYDPRLFLTQDVRMATTTDPLAKSDETITIQTPTGKRQVDDDTTFAIGHVLRLDEGDLAERVQVVGIAGSTLTLSTPLRKAHAAGVPITYVDSLAVGVPDSPLITTGPVSSMPGYSSTPTLSWFSRSPVTGYTLEVATDTSFENIVQTHAEIETDSLQLDELDDRTGYYARVSGTNGLGQGEWSRRFSFFVGRPFGDDLSDALVLPDDYYEGVPAWQIATTAEADEAISSCNGTDESLWFSFTPARTGTFAIASFNSNYDTILSVWTGAQHPLTEVACNDDYDNGDNPTVTQSYVEFEATAGITYYIRASARDGEGGMLMLTIRAPSLVAIETPVEGAGTDSRIEVWPNPTRALTTIAVSQSRPGRIHSEVFDALGRRIAVLADKMAQEGRYQLDWDATGMPVGLYYVVTTIGSERKVASIAVVR